MASGAASVRAIPNDPLFASQWHLRNTGQTFGTPNADANVTPVWDTYRDNGVTIAVVDEGMEYTHEDLSPNYSAALSYDYWGNDNNPAPGSFEDHSTAVGGVAAGKGFNGIGISGAAPDATLAAIRLFSAFGLPTDAQEGAALSHLANARRTLGDLSAAEELLARARRAWESGTGDPLDEAELLYFEASMLRGRRRFDEALRRIRKSARLYRELGDQHLEARSRMNEAHILSISGDPRGGRNLMARILPWFDADRDPKLAFVARHNLVWYTMECGDGDEALRMLSEFREDYEGAGQRSTYARLHWLEGRISEQIGREAEVEAAYGRAIEEFAELELPYELATVSLDLAAFCARNGRATEVRQIAERTMVLFHAIGVAEPMIAAWMIFRRAAEAEAVTAGLIDRLVRYHAEARYRPELEFQG